MSMRRAPARDPFSIKTTATRVRDAPDAARGLWERSLCAQRPNDALRIKQQIERIRDVAHENGRIVHGFSRASFTHVDSDCEALCVLHCFQPQRIISSVAEDNDVARFQLKSPQVLLFELVMTDVARNFVLQRHTTVLGQNLEFSIRCSARVRRYDVYVNYS